MKELVLESGVIWRVNYSLMGGVSAGIDRLREPEPEDEWGLADLNPATTDWYSRDGDVVSIEKEEGQTLELQKRLDDQVIYENLFSNPVLVNGLAPCKRVKKDC